MSGSVRQHVVHEELHKRRALALTGVNAIHIRVPSFSAMPNMSDPGEYSIPSNPEAINHQDIGAMRKCIENGTVLNDLCVFCCVCFEQCCADLTVSDSRTALQDASGKGRLDVVKLLVGLEGVSANGHGNTRTALKVASCRGHLDIVKFLNFRSPSDLDGAKCARYN